MSSFTKKADKHSEERADHAAQKAQSAGCCGTHEHGHCDKLQSAEPAHDRAHASCGAGNGRHTEEQADRSAQKVQGGGCCGH